MHKALFSQIKREIEELLDNAQNEVLVAMAWFTNNDLFNSLLKCIDRNVKVELILLDDAINWSPSAPDFNRFIERGGRFMIAGRAIGFMHHKFCVIDSKVFLTGSYNWTNYAECRNIENVIVSDDSSIALKFKEEFIKISNSLVRATCSPRLSWEEIQDMPDVDYSVLNYEVDYISKVQQLPVRPIIKTKTEVKIVEKERKAISAFNIGIQISKDGNDFTMANLIDHGESLPCMKSLTAYSHHDDRHNLRACIRYGISTDSHYNTLLTDSPISSLTDGRNDLNMKIRFTASLGKDGHVTIDVQCEETAKSIQVVDLIMPELIGYED